MGHKKIKNKHKNCKKIRGSLNCFQGTRLEIMANEIFRAPLIKDNLIEFRNVGKDAFGLRMKRAAKLARVFKVISKKSLEILLNYLTSFKEAPNAFKFADCFFASYNGEVHLLEINEPQYVSNDRFKAFKSGMKDCLKAFKTYFEPILKRMNREGTEGICDYNIVGKYKDIKLALTFSINFLYELHCGELPEKISKEVFEAANNIDSKVGDYYQWDNVVCKYNFKRHKNNKYSVVSQECAAYLICYKHK